MQECWANLKNLRKLLYENAKLHWILFWLLTDIMVLKWKKLYLVKHTEPAILEELYGITLINECAQSNTPGLLFEYIHWTLTPCIGT